jgi:hypothetical protein
MCGGCKFDSALLEDGAMKLVAICFLWLAAVFVAAELMNLLERKEA